MYTYNKSQKEQATISKQTKVSNIAEISEFLKNSEVSKPPGVPSLRLCTASQVIPTISPPPSIIFSFFKRTVLRKCKKEITILSTTLFFCYFILVFCEIVRKYVAECLISKTPRT